jgi:hypothetical protein
VLDETTVDAGAEPTFDDAMAGIEATGEEA